MLIRDALESDVDALSELTGRPRDVLRDQIHDRSVRVAVDEEKEGESADDNGILGFIAFDAQSGTVHVTGFDGKSRAMTRLFEEPRGFGVREGLDIEVVVPDDDSRRVETVKDIGFVSVGDGPRFDGRSTTQFRLEVNGEDD